MKLKVCGMRDAENIRDLQELNPDYMGIIFYPGSPRYAGEVCIPESGGMERVGVFVNAPVGKIVQAMETHHLDLVQLHGDESPEFCQLLREVGIRVIKAFRITEDFSFESLGVFEGKADFYLFDAPGKNYGGNGVVFNWEKLMEYQLRTPFFLSGGITMDHGEAIRKFSHEKLYGIDINSGFEISPGLKNIELIKKFRETYEV